MLVGWIQSLEFWKAGFWFWSIVRKFWIFKSFWNLSWKKNGSNILDLLRVINENHVSKKTVLNIIRFNQVMFWTQIKNLFFRLKESTTWIRFKTFTMWKDLEKYRQQTLSDINIHISIAIMSRNYDGKSERWCAACFYTRLNSTRLCCVYDCESFFDSLVHIVYNIFCSFSIFFILLFGMFGFLLGPPLSVCMMSGY